MALTCARCGQTGEPPAEKRVVLPAPEKARVLGSICSGCWEQWEAVEIRIINEYRLSFANPTHRQKLQEACIEFISTPPQ